MKSSKIAEMLLAYNFSEDQLGVFREPMFRVVLGTYKELSRRGECTNKATYITHTKFHMKEGLKNFRVVEDIGIKEGRDDFVDFMNALATNSIMHEGLFRSDEQSQNTKFCGHVGDLGKISNNNVVSESIVSFIDRNLEIAIGLLRQSFSQDQLKIFEEPIFQFILELSDSKSDFDAMVETLAKYPLDDKQLAVLDSFTAHKLIAEEKSDFESVVKSISSYQLNENQVEIFNHFIARYAVIEGKSDLGDVLKAISEHQLDDNQLKVLDSYLVLKLIKDDLMKFEAVVENISQHHFNAQQAEVFQENISYYFKLFITDKYTFEEILTNLENHDSATKLLAKSDAIDEVKVVETRITDDTIPEVNDELVQPLESQG